VAFPSLKKPPLIVDMSYYVTNENSVLNINNAHLKVSGNVMTDVMKLGAIEFAPPASDVGGTVNFTNVTTGVTTSSNLSVGGTLSLGTVEVVATTHTLANTTANGNVTPHTVQFSNATTGIVTTANVEVGGELAVTGNVEVGAANLFVDTVNSRVGIGTTSPGYLLDVQSTSDAADKNMTRLYSAANASGVSSTGLRVEKGTGYGGIVKGFISQGVGSGLSLHTLNGGTDVQAMTIMNSGNVGIGTTNPVAKFNIQGTSEGAPPTSGGEGTSNGIFRLRDNFNVALDIGTLGASPWSTWLQVADTTTMGAEYPLSLNPNGGNVGIGNRNPLGKLDIFDTDAVRLRLTTSSTNARGSIDIIRGDGGRSPGDYTFGASNYYDWRIGSDDTTDYNFSIRSKNTSLDFTSFYIKGLDGNVGIGTNTPLGRLHVQTETRSGTEGSGNGIYVTSGCAEFSNGSEFRHSNQSQGVGIGYAGIYATGSNTNQDLSIVSRGTGTTYVKNYAVFSDDRIKTNEEYIMNATETLMKLKPQVYDKHEEINVLSDNPKREAGLIAQDIYYDTPELRYIVSTRNRGIDAEPVNIPSEKPFVDDDPQKDPDYSGWGTASAGVAYIQLVPYLIRSNQEIYTELQAEKARNDSLEARILALENA
jgi:hypothetical protein